MKLIIVILLVGISTAAKAQELGFGCLGLVGVSAGFAYQKYSPEGFNNYISDFNSLKKDSLSAPFEKYGIANGYRFGANLFRQNFSGLIFTIKGYYQSVKEKHKAEFNSLALGKTKEFEMQINQWGFGVDIGTNIIGGLDWKVIDAVVVFNNVKLVEKIDQPGQFTSINELKSKESSSGYMLGSGFILHLIRNYVSLEGTTGVSQFSISTIKYSDDAPFPSSPDSSTPLSNFITKGGLFILVQLNIGVPI